MTDTPMITLALYAQTDVGMVRSGNEDNFLILDLSTGKSWTASEEENGELLTFNQGYYGSLLAVSDGMGGALAGEVASRMAVETVRDRMLQLQAHEVYSKIPFHERLRLAVEEANTIINRESGMNPEHKGLGATFTAVAVQGSHVYFAQVGDSRAHLIRQGRIARVTKDQSLVQQLIDAGQITEEEAETHSYRNVILQALGAHSSVNVEVNTLQLRQLDTLLLCSDGLSGKLREDEIASIVAEAPDLKSACHELINLANERGGEDNITVVVAQFSGAGLIAPDREPIEPDLIGRSPDTPTNVSLTESATTRPLENADAPTPSDLTETLDDDRPLRITSPMATPTLPSSPSPPVSTPPRNPPTDTGRTGNISGQRRPITSVFAEKDYEEDEQVTASLRKPQAAATAASPQRSSKSVTEELVDREMVPRAPRPEPSKGRAARARPESRGPKFMLLALGGLMILALCVAAYWYQRSAQQKELERQQNALRQQEQQALQTRINALRERILQAKKVSQDAEPSTTRDAMIQRLTEMIERLDTAGKEASLPDKLATAKQAYDEVEQSFSRLNESNKRSGFPPHRFVNRRPVAC